MAIRSVVRELMVQKGPLLIDDDGVLLGLGKSVILMGLQNTEKNEKRKQGIDGPGLCQIVGILQEKILSILTLDPVSFLSDRRIICTVSRVRNKIHCGSWQN